MFWSYSVHVLSLHVCCTQANITLISTSTLTLPLSWGKHPFPLTHLQVARSDKFNKTWTWQGLFLHHIEVPPRISFLPCEPEYTNTP